MINIYVYMYACVYILDKLDHNQMCLIYFNIDITIPYIMYVLVYNQNNNPSSPTHTLTRIYILIWISKHHRQQSKL